ncbi:MAG: hypothetical protein HKO65_10585 [Gemmatimonadetes bacterium]|nr:hypothetical protein [Gemmatimonadota bacterium]NNM05540.1 hypothetical protein [Gemmatimonadota bacterium]
MSTESRVQHLLRAAERAEREGNPRLAGILRAMAEELRPAEGGMPG